MLVSALILAAALTNMELKTVIANLNNTIAGKEFLLNSLQKEQLSNNLKVLNYVEL